MKKFGILTMLAFIMTAFAINASAQVTVTGSTGANGTYTTLGAAFTAINGAGSQAGNNILVEVSASTSETGPAVLNTKDWSTLTIRPVNDGVTIAGTTATGRGLIELNGADNVTIDGDNPFTAGINRNLTIQNTASATTTYTSAVRIATVAGNPSADNNIIRNTILLGSATGRNISTATSTTGSENTTFGIYAGGNGAVPPSAPTAITSITSNTAPGGTTINNLQITNNEINAAARAIVFNGAMATVSNGVLINNNVIGGAGTLSGAPPYTSPATTVYTKAVWIAGTTSVSITGNTIRNILSYVGTQMNGIELNAAVGATGGVINVNNNTVTGVVNNATSSGARGIDINSAATGTTVNANSNSVSNVQTLASTTIMGFRYAGTADGGLFQKNIVNNVNSRGTGTFGAYGMTFDSGNNHIIRNNFISEVQHNMSGGVAFSTTVGVFGLRIAGGSGHQIYNNSVNLFSAYAGTPNSNLLSAAFAILATTQTNIDVRNNIFVNTNSGGTTNIAHVAVYLPPSGTSAMNLTMNNNDYHSGTTPGVHGVAHVGTTYTAVPAGPATYAGLYSQADFNPASTTPTNNFRAYTSTLSTAGTNDNDSIKVNPLFLSPTDLHVPSTSPVLEEGATIASVTDDIDGDTRPINTFYDIGADERAIIVAPGVLQLSSTTYSGNEGTMVNITVNRVSGSSGPVTVDVTLTDVTATGGALCGGSVDYINPGTVTLTFPDSVSTLSFGVTLCSDVVLDLSETFTVTLSNPTGGATLGSPTTATVTIVDVPPPFAGTYTVGSGGTYPSLTNPGGIFQAINLVGTSGPVTIEIVSDLTGETGTHPLNEHPNAITIKPSGAPRTISGNSSTAIIKLNGADNVTINGSTAGLLVGGNPAIRELTIQNSNTTGAAIWIATNATSGATNNTIKNIKIVGPGAFGGQGIIAGSGATFGAAAENGRPNSNNTIQNNSAVGVRNAVFTFGDATTLDANWNIVENDFGSTVVADKLSFRGIAVQNAQNFIIRENRISGINSSTSTTATMSGILVGGTLSGGSIVRNEIKDIRQNNTTGWGSNGIFLNSASTSAGVTVANNFISDIASQGYNGFDQGDNGYGIMVNSGGGYQIVFNTIVMNANQVSTSGHSSCVNIESGLPVGGVDLRNNIFVNEQTVGNRYSIIDQGTTPAAYSNLNYNDYWNPTGANFGRLNAVNHTTLAAWQSATGLDANSLNVDPSFISATNFHLQATSSVRNVGTPITGITDDIDGQTRPNPVDSFVIQVDIGADEFYPPLAANASISGRVMTAGGNGIRNAIIMVTGGGLSEPRYAQTGTFGYYVFDNLPVGNTYVVTVISRRYIFSNPTRTVTLDDNVTDLNFEADGK